MIIDCKKCRKANRVKLPESFRLAEGSRITFRCGKCHVENVIISRLVDMDGRSAPLGRDVDPVERLADALSRLPAAKPRSCQPVAQPPQAKPFDEFDVPTDAVADAVARAVDGKYDA